jgi:hypothetical protein
MSRFWLLLSPPHNRMITDPPRSVAPSLASGYASSMATAKKGILTHAREWWKHLRRTKRTFWKGERQAARREAEKQADV